MYAADATSEEINKITKEKKMNKLTQQRERKGKKFFSSKNVVAWRGDLCAWWVFNIYIGPPFL